jgi:hypothetical protein
MSESIRSEKPKINDLSARQVDVVKSIKKTSTEKELNPRDKAMDNLLNLKLEELNRNLV